MTKVKQVTVAAPMTPISHREVLEGALKQGLPVDYIKAAREFTKPSSRVSETPFAFKLVLAELTEHRKCLVNVTKRLENMDKKILAVKDSMDKKMNKLVALDKPRDRKLEKCEKVMKKSPKKTK